MAFLLDFDDMLRFWEHIPTALFSGWFLSLKKCHTGMSFLLVFFMTFRNFERAFQRFSEQGGGQGTKGRLWVPAGGVYLFICYAAVLLLLVTPTELHTLKLARLVQHTLCSAALLISYHLLCRRFYPWFPDDAIDSQEDNLTALRSYIWHGLRSACPAWATTVGLAYSRIRTQGGQSA